MVDSIKIENWVKYVDIYPNNIILRDTRLARKITMYSLIIFLSHYFYSNRHTCDIEATFEISFPEPTVDYKHF